jgi:hypothetical protein
MKDLKFIRVLTQIPKSDLSKIEKFFESPYCNTNPLLTKIFELIQNDLKSGKELKIDKEHIWQKILPDVPFNDPKWRKLCNEFLLALQKYFVFEQLSRNELISGNLLLEYVYEHNLEVLYKSSSSHVETELKKHKNLSSEYHLQKFQLKKICIISGTLK